MRAPSFVRDGWCLEDGEKRHREAPATFHIPDLALREILQPGDLAKLIFRIAVEGDEHGAVERMWVIIRERVPGGYVGMLDNDPDSIAKNDRFWCGAELPFEYRHIIAVSHADEASTALAKAPVPIPGIGQANSQYERRLWKTPAPWQHGGRFGSAPGHA